MAVMACYTLLFAFWFGDSFFKKNKYLQFF